MERKTTLEQMTSLENLLVAAHRARRGKSRRPDVEAWHLREESHLLELREQLLAGTWQPQPYRLFLIREPKHRQIAAAPYGDRVVHHALCNVMNPLLQRRFLARSYSFQEGKGTTAARECCRRLANRHRYVLKCDVRKFYDSIPHGVLSRKLAGLLHCPGLLRVAQAILHSYHATPGRGLPIGNLTSQWWGNFYLDGLDHWIAEQQGHGSYLRYTDDFLIFGDDKARLWELRTGVVAHLESLELELALPKSRLLACREGVPFCGFRFLPCLRPRVLGGTKRRFEARHARQIKEGDTARLTASTFAWYQFSKEGNTEGLRQAWATVRPQPG